MGIEDDGNDTCYLAVNSIEKPLKAFQRNTFQFGSMATTPRESIVY